MIDSLRDGGSNSNTCQDYLDNLEEESGIFKQNKILFWKSCFSHALQDAFKSRILYSIAPPKDETIVSVMETRSLFQPFIIWTKQIYLGALNLSKYLTHTNTKIVKTLTPVKNIRAYMVK